MSKITITMDTGNAAFDDGAKDGEVARILHELADKIEAGGCRPRTLYDINGNKVGELTVKGKHDGN